MMPRIKPPRLLPITIFALAGLLAMKSVELVRVAAAAVAESQAVVTTAQAASPAAPEHMPPASPSAQPAATPSAQPAATPSAQPAATPSAEDSAAPVGDGERTVLLELRQRRQELDSRETALAARESLMAATEQKLSGRVAELQTLQKKLEALEATRQEREDTSWQRMVKLYETMKPRDAATIFNDLEMPVLLQVLDRMKEAKAAPVLAAMQPDKARDVTAQIARLRTSRDGPGTRMTGG
jgi:flagellar motility protein MotE (MotC chaperone)